MSMNSAAEKGTRPSGVDKAFMQGLQIGLEVGMQKAVLQVLSHRFQKLPFGIGGRIFGKSDKELERLLKAALEVNSPEELMTDGAFD